MKFGSTGVTDVGRKRQHNEDAYFQEDELGLYVVCDGMGGHAAGEVASAKTIEVVRDQVRAHVDVVKALAAEPNPKNRAAAIALIETAVQRACNEVYKMAQTD